MRGISAIPSGPTTLATIIATAAITMMLLLLCALPVMCAHSNVDSGDVKRPNILFILVDQFRNDLLDEPNHIHVPNIHERIVKQGVRFTHAYASTPICTPSRAALLTGLSPWNHGMLGYGVIAPKYTNELPQKMVDAGYIATAIGKNHFGWNHTKPVDHGYGFMKIYDGLGNGMPGSDDYDDYDQWFQQQQAGKSPLTPTGLNWNDWRGRPYGLDEWYHPTTWTGYAAIDRLERIHEQGLTAPWFMKVSFHRPHSPYDPPARWLNATTEAGFKPQATSDNWGKQYAGPSAECGPKHNAAWCGHMPDNENAITRRAYHANVAMIDHWIGRIIDIVNQLDYGNNTMIVFTSDHGDMQGDHNLWRKGFPYEGSSHIPMLMRWPKSWEDKVVIPRGSTSPLVTEIRDLMPTFLDVAGSHAQLQLDGSSLLCPILKGAQCAWPRSWIDMEHTIVYNDTIHWNALTDGTVKYIFNAFDGSEMFFDLVADPNESHNSIRDARYQSQISVWRQRMVDQFVREHRGDAWVRDGKLQIRKKGTLYSPHYPGNTSWVPHWDAPSSSLTDFYD